MNLGWNTEGDFGRLRVVSRIRVRANSHMDYAVNPREHSILLKFPIFPLDKIGEAYRIFGERLDGAIKVAVKP